MKSKKITVNKNSFEFLWYSCFRVPFGYEKKKIICADRAYLDLCRTLKYKESDEEKHKEFRNKVNKKIIEEIDGLLIANDKNSLNNRYKNAFKKIIEISKAYTKEFHIGQAQKWMNMTVKYMLVMELHTKEFSLIRPFLHVPVDNEIITAAKNNLHIPVSSKSWSKWDWNEYKEFQTNLQDNLDISAIDWEHTAWIEQLSKKR